MNVVAILLCALASSVPPPSAPSGLSPEEKDVIRVAVETEFLARPGPPFSHVVVVLDQTDNWLPIDLVDGVKREQVFELIDGLEAANQGLPVDLSDSRHGFPSYGANAFIRQDQESAGPQCVAMVYGLPVTVAYVSRPYVARAGDSALVALGQRHSWNHCGLWSVVHLERVNGAWRVVGYLRTTLW